MGLFDRWSRRRRDGDRSISPGRSGPEVADREHLENFVATRRGVEAYIEPRTTVTDTTVVLVAHDGEWTRRRVADPGAARDFGSALGIGVYDVEATGYPARMRAWTRAQSKSGRTRATRPDPPAASG